MCILFSHYLVPLQRIVMYLILVFFYSVSICGLLYARLWKSSCEQGQFNLFPRRACRLVEEMDITQVI